MTMRYLKYVFPLLFLVSCAPLAIYSQTKIESCGLNLVIPDFVENKPSAFSVEKKQALVERGILLPIEKSKSQFEIRYYTVLHGLPGPTTVIKCDGSATTITQFSFYFDSHVNPGPPIKVYKNFGPLPGHPNSDMFVYINNNIRLKGGQWHTFFKDLVVNDFFSLIPEDEIKSIIKRKHPDQNVQGEALWCIEVKVGERFRYMNYSLVSNQQVNDVKPYLNLMNVYTIFNQIK